MNYKFNITMQDALNLGGVIGTMTEGGAASKEQRYRVLKKILAKFPELDNASLPRDAGRREEIELDKREVRAVAHGLIDKMNATPRINKQGEKIEGCNGADYGFLRSLAEKMRMWKYISGIIKPDAAPEFDGELDDEGDIVEEAAEQPKEG